MPSPFPRMDPNLEGELWTTVHAALSVEIARQLAPLLRPKYVALIEKRFVLDMPDVDEGIAIDGSLGSTGDIYPDVAVAEFGPSNNLSVASISTTAPLQLATVMPTSVPLHTVEIRDVAERRLVTVIEVLLPTNKRGDGRDEYLERRRRLLLSTTHLLEVDLLRAGRRVPMVKALPLAPYFIFLSRSHRRPMTEIWPIALNQPLPTVPVPLLPGDAEVPMDVQQAFTSIYDSFGYDLVVNYTLAQHPPLSPDQAEWVKERLRVPRSA